MQARLIFRMVEMKKIAKNTSLQNRGCCKKLVDVPNHMFFAGPGVYSYKMWALTIWGEFQGEPYAICSAGIPKRSFSR